MKIDSISNSSKRFHPGPCAILHIFLFEDNRDNPIYNNDNNGKIFPFPTFLQLKYFLFNSPPVAHPTPVR